MIVAWFSFLRSGHPWLERAVRLSVCGLFSPGGCADLIFARSREFPSRWPEADSLPHLERSLAWMSAVPWLTLHFDVLQKQKTPFIRWYTKQLQYLSKRGVHKMGREEQKEEREVLDSIFPDEIQDISDTEYRITIVLDTPKEADDDSQGPTIILNVKYPDSYPDEAPYLDITQPPNASKHEHLDIQEDKARLLEALQPTIEESVGMAMVFTLVSTLKDAAELLISERQNAVQALKDMEARKAEEEENRKFEGEKVTRESFLAWQEKFKKEMEEEAARRQAEQEAEDKRKKIKAEVKLTGKQLWEQGLTGKTAEEDEDGEDAILDGMKQVKVEG